MNSKFYFLLFAVLLIPLFTFAEEKTLYLVGIPGVEMNSDFNTYINALYKLSIAIAALLAVIKIIIAGLKWMLTDLITSKEDAKKDIQGAVLGLLIIIAAVVILNEINPQLTKTQIFIAPSEPMDFSEVSIEKKASDCVGKYGSYAWDSTTNTCKPSEDALKKETGIIERELSCTNAEGKNDNCAYSTALCKSKDGIPSPSYSGTGAIQNWRIICTPTFVKHKCEEGGGVWDTEHALCIKKQ